VYHWTVVRRGSTHVEYTFQRGADDRDIFALHVKNTLNVHSAVVIK
jgi:hypothetical protein